jgi:arylsulfatase
MRRRTESLGELLFQPPWWASAVFGLFFPLLATAALHPQPHIVVILADDMGWSDLGCHGSEIQTPNLDALARNGLRFSQFYNTGGCCPSRASLMTGLYAHQAGIGHVLGETDLPGYQANLRADNTTIPELLQQAGYATFMCGK